MEQHKITKKAKSRFKITPAVYLVLIKNNKILLLRRYNTGHHDGEYSFVAGHLKEKETIRQAMQREAREEAGLEIALDDFTIVHIMNRFSGSNPDYPHERIDIYLKADKWQGELKNLEPEKCDQLGWFDLDNLPENIVPYIRQVIKCLNKSVLYSEWGWDVK